MLHKSFRVNEVRQNDVSQAPANNQDNRTKLEQIRNRAHFSTLIHQEYNRINQERSQQDVSNSAQETPNGNNVPTEIRDRYAQIGRALTNSFPETHDIITNPLTGSLELTSVGFSDTTNQDELAARGLMLEAMNEMVERLEEKQKNQKQWDNFAILRDNDELDKDISNIRKAAKDLKITLNYRNKENLMAKVEMIQRIMSRADSFSITSDRNNLDKNPAFKDASEPPDEDPSQPKGEYPNALNYLFKLKNDEICNLDTNNFIRNQSEDLKRAITTLENKVKPSDSTSRTSTTEKKQDTLGSHSLGTQEIGGYASTDQPFDTEQIAELPPTESDKKYPELLDDEEIGYLGRSYVNKRIKDISTDYDGVFCSLREALPTRKHKGVRTHSENAIKAWRELEQHSDSNVRAQLGLIAQDVKKEIQSIKDEIQKIVG